MRGRVFGAQLLPLQKKNGPTPEPNPNSSQVNFRFHDPGLYRIRLSVSGNGKDDAEIRVLVHEQTRRLAAPIRTVVEARTRNQSTRTVRQAQFRRVQDIHSGFNSTRRCYTEFVDATPGSVIVDARYIIESENRVSGVRLNIDETGNRASIEYCLTSGPSFDRWRGWITLTLTFVEKAQEQGSTVVLDSNFVLDAFGEYRLESAAADADVESYIIRDINAEFFLELPHGGATRAIPDSDAFIRIFEREGSMYLELL